jgi:hypothetical protein
MRRAAYAVGARTAIETQVHYAGLKAAAVAGQGFLGSA